MDTYYPTYDNITPLGRTRMAGSTLWLAHSGSGAAFTFFGTRAQITLLGDDTASLPDQGESYARIAVFVNGRRVADNLMDAPEKEITVWESGQAAPCSVEIIKLSESAMSTLGIAAIRLETQNGISPAPEKSRYIEFIGDSITCGYGMDDENPEHAFSTATEDVTKAYAFRTARELNADYSMVSFSGYGIISGYTGEGEPQKPEQIVPPYYDKFGFSYGKFQGLSPQDMPWDFRRNPQLVVVNLGTNDDSFTQDFPDRQTAYQTAYTRFLKQIREKNPQAKILCTLGIMGQRLFPFVEKAVDEYQKETLDSNISCFLFDEQLASDGYTANWHPTAVTHRKAAAKLTAKIRELMNWE